MNVEGGAGAHKNYRLTISEILMRYTGEEEENRKIVFTIGPVSLNGVETERNKHTVFN